MYECHTQEIQSREESGCWEDRPLPLWLYRVGGLHFPAYELQPQVQKEWFQRLLGEGDVGGAGMARGRAQSERSNPQAGARCEQLPCALQQLSLPGLRACAVSPASILLALF